jgi:hypothetical protein
MFLRPLFYLAHQARFIDADRPAKRPLERAPADRLIDADPACA